jgi:hypothetical protein
MPSLIAPWIAAIAPTPSTRIASGSNIFSGYMNNSLRRSSQLRLAAGPRVHVFQLLGGLSVVVRPNYQRLNSEAYPIR